MYSSKTVLAIKLQFSSLSIENWRQFRDAQIIFHERMTILTGPNGAGKTTLLNMLSRLIGWSVALLAAPEGDRRSIKRIISNIRPDFYETSPTGHVILSNNSVLNLDLSNQNAIKTLYGPINGAQGVYVTSHRPLYSYAAVTSIPTSVNYASELLRLYTEHLVDVYQVKENRHVVDPSDAPSFRLKQTLMALAVFGEGNSSISGDSEAFQTFKEFESILREVLPKEVGFEGFFIQMPELFVISQHGMFPLESISGGAAAIVDLAWQVYLASKIYDNFVVLIDEPENHLHPSLQKRLLPSFISAFPKAKFIVATHSPLMITSIEDSAVYVLKQDEGGRFTSRQLDFRNKSASAEQTLYDVLGVDGSTPIWASNLIENIVQRYEGQSNDISSLRQMRDELRQAGLADQITRVLDRLAELESD